MDDDSREFDHDRISKIIKYRYNILTDNITCYVLNYKIVKLMFEIIINYIHHLCKTKYILIYFIITIIRYM